MARMIPSLIPDKDISPGEKELFRILRDHEDSGDWIVLHSYDLPKDRSGVRREIDFLVVVPNLGVCVVEVKAHTSVTRDADGNWYLGKSGLTKKSPVNQVKDATYALKRDLQTIGLGNIKVAPLLVFTDTDVPNITELDEENQLSTGQGPISNTTTGQVLRSLLSEPGLALQSGDEEKLVNWARPSFEVIASPRLRKERVLQEIKTATSVQLRAFDAIAINPRVLIEGPPGSGKTATAIEAARRSASSGKTVALLCFNSLLGRHLSSEASGEFPASSVFNFVVDVLQETPPSDATFEWWRQAAVRCATLLRPEHKFDVLVVDEFQDLHSQPWLGLLDAILKGGLAEGNWVFTGDSQFQNIQNNNLRTDIVGKLSPTRVTFQDNCRNPERQGRWVEKLAFGRDVYRSYLRGDSGSLPEVRIVDSSLESPVGLAINSLKQRFSSRDIVVICSSQQNQRRLIEDLSLQEYFPGVERVSVSTTRSFKGLEASAVILDLDLDWPNEEIITAATRATEELVILIQREQERQLIARLET